MKIILLSVAKINYISLNMLINNLLCVLLSFRTEFYLAQFYLVPIDIKKYYEL